MTSYIPPLLSGQKVTNLDLSGTSEFVEIIQRMQDAIAAPALVTAAGQPIVFKSVETSANITDALATHRVVTLAAGEHNLDAPIYYPSDERSFEFGDPGGRAWALHGVHRSMTKLIAQHSGEIITQQGSGENGIYDGPEITKLTVVGNAQTPVALALDGWRGGLIEGVRVMSVPNGIGIFLDGTTAGGSWYNKILRCAIGDRTDAQYWVHQGIKLAGFAGDSGKTNENTIEGCWFWNCTDYCVGLDGVGDFDETHPGIYGGSAFNRTIGNTFYSQQALFQWDEAGEHIYQPKGIYDNTNGGHLSHGDYFERLHSPIWQTQNVADGRFNIPTGEIKNSGVFSSAQVNIEQRECYRVGGGFMGNVGYNSWAERTFIRN